MTDSTPRTDSPEPGQADAESDRACPVCGADLDTLDIRAHHDSHFNLNQPIQNWSTLSKQQSDQLLKLAGERRR